MLINCKIRRTSIPSEIKSTLQKNSVIIPSTYGILIGSRAARYYLSNFRGIRHEQNIDWNIISSSEFFLAWWNEHDEQIQTMNMIIPKIKDENKLDLYINCIMYDQSKKYNFIIPRSSLTYTTFILENSHDWIEKQFSWTKLIRKGNCIVNASVKLLLILKKYMLYYKYQWKKTANDYRELLTINDPLTDEDRVLCDLIVQYNEKIYGKRQLDTLVNVNQDEFFQQKKCEQIELIYKTTMSISTTGDILIGMEYLCTQGPYWLADYVIDNWISIQNEKFKQKFPIFRSCIKFNIDNLYLFPQLPENLTYRILHYIPNAIDFHSMQFVCKRWYTLIHKESFWRDLYISRYGNYSTSNIWKMLYLTRIEEQLIDRLSRFDELINASIDLRRFTGNDVLRLWEDLTHREQRVNPVILSRIDYILSNVFYYQMNETSNQFSVKLIIDGHSLTKLYLTVQINEYKTLQFIERTEELLIECQFNDKSIIYSSKFLGPNLLGFDLDCLGYLPIESILLTSTPNSAFPAFPMGLLICLFIIMIHPIHRTTFIQYLKNLESHCLKNLSV